MGLQCCANEGWIKCQRLAWEGPEGHGARLHLALGRCKAVGGAVQLLAQRCKACQAQHVRLGVESSQILRWDPSIPGPAKWGHACARSHSHEPSTCCQGAELTPELH